MNSPFNNSRAGVTLLETLVMLAIFALIILVASSGFRGGRREGNAASVLASVSQSIIIARNDALRSGKDTTLTLEALNSSLTGPEISVCDFRDGPSILLFADGTIFAPILCVAEPLEMRVSIDWLTGQPSNAGANPDD